MTQPTPSRRLQITLQPSVLRWARERVNLTPEALAEKLNVKPDRVTQWEQSGKISIAQADRLAARTFTPLGYLYLEEPPDDSLPIHDFRTPTRRPAQAPKPQSARHHLSDAAPPGLDARRPHRKRRRPPPLRRRLHPPRRPHRSRRGHAPRPRPQYRLDRRAEELAQKH